jgi:hypothetical protein
MKRIAPAGLLLLVACASGHGPQRTDLTDLAVRGSATGDAVREDVRLTTSPGTAAMTLPAPVDAVWALMPAVYAELGLPVTATDPSQKVIVSQNQRLARIDGRRLSSYFRCGGTYGNNADNGNTLVYVKTQIMPNPEGATARVEVRALATEPGATTAGECGSIGSLERLIVTTIQQMSSAAPL